MGGQYLTGFQFEDGLIPTSYIPTTTAAVTRNADLPQPIDLTGCYNGTIGTFTFDIDRAFAVATDTPIISINGSTGVAFQIFADAASNTIAIFNGDAERTNYEPVGKWAVVSDGSQINVYRNGVSIIDPFLAPMLEAPEEMQIESTGCISALKSFAFSKIPFSAELAIAETL